MYSTEYYNTIVQLCRETFITKSSQIVLPPNSHVINNNFNFKDQKIKKFCLENNFSTFFSTSEDVNNCCMLQDILLSTYDISTRLQSFLHNSSEDIFKWYSSNPNDETVSLLTCLTLQGMCIECNYREHKEQ